MPIYKTKNENFFQRWSPKMAYVLGFFTADGNMIKNRRGGCFIEFEIIDKKLLEIIKKTFNSNHKITPRHRSKHTSYRLQIGSKVWFRDLQKLNLFPQKSKTVDLPFIPGKYFSHFVRGYFDGDGNVVFGFFRKIDRTRRFPALLTRFTSGSRLILEKLKLNLTKAINTKGSLLYYSRASRLSYGMNDSKKLFLFMYNNGNTRGLIYLKRKYNIYRQALRKTHAVVA